MNTELFTSINNHSQIIDEKEERSRKIALRKKREKEELKRTIVLSIGLLIGTGVFLEAIDILFWLAGRIG